MSPYKLQGIIFDMDNTLLRSSIDFDAMKHELFQFLLHERVLPEKFPVADHTASTMIDCAAKAGMNEDQSRHIWEIVARHESCGMEEAGLEPGVEELLPKLKNGFKLAVVTNNSCEAAVKALERTNIREHFELIVGREQMTALKPSPSGFHYVLRHYPDIPVDRWLSVGDSWIDGQAAKEAGLHFVSYRTSLEVMERKGVRPDGYIETIADIVHYLRSHEN